MSEIRATERNKEVVPLAAAALGLLADSYHAGSSGRQMEF